MPHQDLAIYAVHILCWTSFGIARRMVRKPPADPAPPEAASEKAAPHSRLLVTLHSVAFGVMYFGIANAVIPGRVPEWFEGQRVVGTLVIALGAVMMSWALVWFQSWRFRAALSADHQLATGGPFHYVRHPIYLGLDLVALGSAIWVPTPTLWVATLWMIIGSDFRGRAEEKLLAARFGEEYTSYLAGTRRFIPGIY
jgi:protein-S-isoprenylcysteine O-methyltransferase Ste14